MSVEPWILKKKGKAKKTKMWIILLLMGGLHSTKASAKETEVVWQKRNGSSPDWEDRR